MREPRAFLRLFARHRDAAVARRRDRGAARQRRAGEPRRDGARRDRSATATRRRRSSASRSRRSRSPTCRPRRRAALRPRSQLLVNGVRGTRVPTLYGAAPTRPGLRHAHRRRRYADGAVRRRHRRARDRRPVGRTSSRRIVRARASPVASRAGTADDAARPADGRQGRRQSAAGRRRRRSRDDWSTRARPRPARVRTFGRAVSLRDFEDIALMAGEVAKATATWVWTGERRAIHLTVAAQGGAIFSRRRARAAARHAAARARSEPQAADRQLRAVAVRDRRIDHRRRRYVATPCSPRRAPRCSRALSFDQRRFAQPVYLSDIFACCRTWRASSPSTSTCWISRDTDPGFRAAHGVDDTLPQPQPRLLMLPARPAGGSSTDRAAGRARLVRGPGAGRDAAAPGEDLSYDVTDAASRSPLRAAAGALSHRRYGSRR